VTLRPTRWIRSNLTQSFVLVMCTSLALLGVFTYRATNQWQRSAMLLAARRAQQAADLLTLALIRDMRSAQASVLASQDWSAATPQRSAEASHLLASAFARLSYPEVFFSWRDDEPRSSVRFFARLDRSPIWLTIASNEDLFPVAIGTSPAIGERVMERVSRDAAHQRRSSIFDLLIGADTYQVVTRLGYSENTPERLHSVLGFMVNLNWVRQHYFGDIVRQVSRIAGAGSALTFSLSHEGSASDSDASNQAAVGRRTLVMAFFDPLVVAIDRPPDLTLEEWTITASATGDEMLRSARVDARRTLVLTGVAALVFAAGLFLSVSAMHAQATLAQLRADFVSTVTHELKTPIAAIRAAGDTLLSHRVMICEGSRKYAHIVVEQSKQLTRLLDNLLAYSRVTDVTEAYSFRPVAVSEIVEEILKNSQPRLEGGGFSVSVAIPANLPHIRADWTAIYLAFDNLLDNSIRYSKDQRWLSVAACVTHEAVRVDIVDRGIGIPANEIAQVTKRFFRGSGSGSGGSGLGLAIAQRIVSDHGGSLDIQSTVGVGTTVSVTLPMAVAQG
jgi:signal transduction histidine kinase